MHRLFFAAVAGALAIALPIAGPAAADHHPAPLAHAAVTCADFPNQAAAQRAHNTRDADGDGIYCESLPCPCSSAKSTAGSPHHKATRPRPHANAACVTPAGVKSLIFSAAKYPNIRRHFLAAVHKGWPRVLVLNRVGASQRRARLLEDVPTRSGYDRDEYPPAEARSSWRADVAYVPSSENRSHGATMGDALRGFCDGTKFRYVFR